MCVREKERERERGCIPWGGHPLSLHAQDAAPELKCPRAEEDEATLSSLSPLPVSFILLIVWLLCLLFFVLMMHHESNSEG